VCFWLFPSSKRVHKVGNRPPPLPLSLPLDLSLQFMFEVLRVGSALHRLDIRTQECVRIFPMSSPRSSTVVLGLAMRPIPTHTCPAGVSRLVWISPTPLHEQQVRIPSGKISAHHVMNIHLRKGYIYVRAYRIHYRDAEK
jgi:hypothetical protein